MAGWVDIGHHGRQAQRTVRAHAAGHRERLRGVDGASGGLPAAVVGGRGLVSQQSPLLTEERTSVRRHAVCDAACQSTHAHMDHLCNCPATLQRYSLSHCCCLLQFGCCVKGWLCSGRMLHRMLLSFNNGSVKPFESSHKYCTLQ